MFSFSFFFFSPLLHHYLHRHCFLPLSAFLLMIFNYATCPYSHLSSNGPYNSPLFPLISITLFSHAVLLLRLSSFLAWSPSLLPSLYSLPFNLSILSDLFIFCRSVLNLSLSRFLPHSPSSPHVRIASELFLITPICHLTLAKLEESNTFIRKLHGSDLRVSLTSCVFPLLFIPDFLFLFSLSLVFSHLRGNILILIFRSKRSSNKSLNLRISRTQLKKIYTLFLPPTQSLVVGSFGNRCRRLLEPSRRLP